MRTKRDWLQKEKILDINVTFYLFLDHTYKTYAGFPYHLIPVGIVEVVMVILVLAGV